MFLTIHTLFALIFVKFIPHPFWAFLFGFLSHLLLDAIPHGDKEIHAWSQEKKRTMMPILALIDGVILLIFLYFLQSNLSWPLFSGLALVVGAVMPDAISGFFLVFFKNPSTNPWEKIHAFFHLSITKKLISMKIGIWIQLLFLITCLYFLQLLYK